MGNCYQNGGVIRRVIRDSAIKHDNIEDAGCVMVAPLRMLTRWLTSDQWPRAVYCSGHEIYNHILTVRAALASVSHHDAVFVFLYSQCKDDLCHEIHTLYFLSVRNIIITAVILSVEIPHNSVQVSLYCGWVITNRIIHLLRKQHHANERESEF